MPSSKSRYKVFQNLSFLTTIIIGTQAQVQKLSHHGVDSDNSNNLTPIGTFYPPTINSTSYISDGSIGTYGGIYTAPAEEATGGSPYGVYDYCSMPHPRVQEYQLPTPIQSGKVQGKLVFLEYIQRHQRRTAYNILPGGENQPYNCDNVLPYLYAGPASPLPQYQSSSNEQGPLPVYAQTYTDPTNPFVAIFGVNSTCQFPQLTLGGLLDGYQHGRDLWSVYGEKLHLIPSDPDTSGGSKIWLRSSSSPLTQQSAGGVLRGIWPEYRGVGLPLHQQVTSVDTVNEGYGCGKQGSVLSAIESTSDWNAHLSVTASLRSQLGSMLGATDGAWQSTFDHFADNFQARLCNGYQLPCNTQDTTQCVTTAQADEVFRAGDWEWNYYWRANPNATEYIQVVEGLFIGEILAHLNAVKQGNGRQELVYAHTFVHDGDLGPVLGALGINALRWPGMGSNIAIEIWQTSGSSSGLYARVLYSGQPLQTIHGTLDWLSLDDLVAILRPFVPTNIVALCNS